MKDDFLPTPEQIKEACVEIRKKWSESELHKRTAIKRIDYTVPVCDVTPSCNEFESEAKIYRS